MVKLELKRKQEVLQQRVLRGCTIRMENWNISVTEPMEAIVERSAGKQFVRVASVNGITYLVNLNLVEVIVEKMILELFVTDTEWNGGYGSDSDNHPTGYGYREYFSLGSTNEYEIVNGSRSGGGIEIKEVSGQPNRGVSLYCSPLIPLNS